MKNANCLHNPLWLRFIESSASHEKSRNRLKGNFQESLHEIHFNNKPANGGGEKSRQQHTLQKLVFKDSSSVFDVACVLFYYVYVKLKEFCSAKRQEKIESQRLLAVFGSVFLPVETLFHVLSSLFRASSCSYVVWQLRFWVVQSICGCHHDV